MSVKIFCNACQKYIKDATKNDLNSLTGQEVCVDCQQKVKTVFDDVEKVARRGIVQIERKRDDLRVELERMVKKVIKADEQS